MADREMKELAKAFERAYQYYKGWFFEYLYPGFMSFSQMGGDITVLFTPDWNTKGRVAIQIQNLAGEILRTEEITYEPPQRNGIPYEKAHAWTLFRIVRPYLEEYMNW